MVTEPTRRKILVADDEEENRILVKALLAPLRHEISLAENGEEALEKARQDPPDLILLDVMMPGLDGFHVAASLKKDEATRDIPIVMVTALDDVTHRVKALESGADDFLAKPVECTELTARVQSLLKVKAYNDYMRDYQRSLEAEVSRRTQELATAFDRLRTASLDTINRLSSAAEYKDEDTGSHIVRMSLYAAAVARHLGLGTEAADRILYAAPMHDVGKIGIPDAILLKPAKLDPVEWETMKQHTVIGGQILASSDSDFIQTGERIALTHHERWDGSGYPKGLSETDIPVEGRVTAIADVFDALTSRRPYKKAFSVEKSFQIIAEDSAGHFDPDVVDAFFAARDEILAIKSNNRDGDGHFFGNNSITSELSRNAT
jgi:putative two-component system response regulator